MANSKGWKWVVGMGSVGSLAIFLNAVQGTEVQKVDEKEYVTSEIKNLTKKERQARVQWISTLDWEDGNWDVDATADSATFTPTGDNGRPQADTRTRRS